MTSYLDIQQKKAEKAVAVYSKLFLKGYDLWVHQVASPLFFDCNLGHLRLLYIRNVKPVHLEVGVGTGLFMEVPDVRERITDLTLMDMSTNCLEVASERLADKQPTTKVANLLEPFDFGGKQFESIGINYVFHCVPGSFKEKGNAFQYLATALKDDGLLFGSTVLAPVEESPIAPRLLEWAYNRLGVFNNKQDSIEELEQSLKLAFDDVEIIKQGEVAIFMARQPKRD